MWEELYEDFWDRLVRFCARLCKDDSRAEDLAQETFLRALQNAALLQTLNKAQRKAWLFQTARNLYCDEVRRAAKEEQLMETFLPASGEEPPDATALAALGGVEMNSLLGLVSPLDRTLFTLRYEEGYNAAELGEMFHLPPATVRTRLARTRNILKHNLTEE